MTAWWAGRQVPFVGRLLHPSDEEPPAWWPTISVDPPPQPQCNSGFVGSDAGRHQPQTPPDTTSDKHNNQPNSPPNAPGPAEGGDPLNESTPAEPTAVDAVAPPVVSSARSAARDSERVCRMPPDEGAGGPPVVPSLARGAPRGEAPEGEEEADDMMMKVKRAIRSS